MRAYGKLFASLIAVLLLGAVLPANAATIQLRAWLNGAQVPLAVGGTGLATVTFDTVTKVVTWNVSYSGLSGEGTCTAAHFHGPAAAGVNSVNTPVGMTCPANPLTGSTVLNPTQETQLLSGQWYINIHTAANPSGEIRGQVVRVRGDLDGDGKADMVLRHETAGTNYLWRMNGTALGPTAALTTVADLNWQLIGVGDFNGDGKEDLIWRHGTSGLVFMWLMNGSAISSSGAVITLADQNWVLAGTGDFDADGKTDLFWRHAVTGQTYVWKMNGLAISSSGSPSTVADLAWKVVGTGDFNGDGKADVLWRHDESGQNYVWQMNGLALGTSGPVFTLADRLWRVAGVGDLDGDGRADIVWRHDGTGQVFAWKMAGFAIASSAAVSTVADRDWKIVASGDYNGDGRMDLFWRHLGTGQTYVWLMNGLALGSSGSPFNLADKLWTPQGPFAGRWAGLVGAQAAFEQIRQVVNTQGANLAASHITPLLDAAYLHEGKDATVDAGYFASDLRGATLNPFTNLRDFRYDPVSRMIQLEALFSVTAGSETFTELLSEASGGEAFKRQSNGTWKIAGNRLPGQLGVQVEMRTDSYPGSTDGPRQHVNVHVNTAQDAFTAVTITGGNGLFNNASVPKSAGVSVDTVQADPEPAAPLTYYYDQWFTGANSALTGPSFFTFTLTPASGPAVSHKVLSNNVTTQYVTITSPTLHTLAAANLGNALTVNWTLPGFPIGEVQLSGYVRTAVSPNPGFQCQAEGPSLATNATTGQIVLPNSCNGESILEAGINVSVDGVNGERTMHIFLFQ